MTKKLSAVEVADYLDELHEILGREVTPGEIVDRVRDPESEGDKRAGLSFTWDLDMALDKLHLYEARRLIRRAEPIKVNVPSEPTLVEISRAVSDVDENGNRRYARTEIDEDFVVSQRSRGSIARSLQADLVSRVLARKGDLTVCGAWPEFEAAIEAFHVANSDHLSFMLAPDPL